MRARESTKKRMLGEKRCGMPGRTAPHYEHSQDAIISDAQMLNRMKKRKGTTRTNTKRAAHGARTNAVKRAETGRRGSFGSARKVYIISERAW